MSNQRSSGLVPVGCIALLGIGCAGILGFMAVTAAAPSGEATLEQLKQRLPNTEVNAIDCERIDGLCEVVSGPNVVYTDRRARFLIVGRVYDMQTRADLTAARLLELAPDALVKGGPRAVEGPRRPAAASIDLTVLPKTGGVTWGPENGPRVIVFTDFACPHCRMLHTDLARLGARVTEYPIAFMGSRPQAEAVLCARRPQEAIIAAYRGEAPAAGQPVPECDRGAVDANEAFFTAQGWQGTPVIIRADGRVLEGRMEAAGLAAWLKEARV